MAELEVIDAHTHVQRSPAHGEEMYRYALGNTVAVDPDEPVAYGTVDETRRMMRETGVAHVNFVLWNWAYRYYTDGQYLHPDDPAEREQADRELKSRIVRRIHGNNEWALSVVGEHPDMSFFCGVDPEYMAEATLMEEVIDVTGRGTLGVKMVPAWGPAPDDRRWWPVYEYCTANEVPILSMTGARDMSRPARFLPALQDFPRLKLICAHLGNNPTFGAGTDAEFVELARSFENVHGDVSLRFNEVAEGAISPDRMVAYLRQIGTERILYGSNWVYVEYRRSMMRRGQGLRAGTGGRPQMTETKRALEVLHTLPLTDQEREQIAAENFRRVTGPGRRG